MRIRHGAPGGDLFGGDEAFTDPPVERESADFEELFCFGDGDRDDIVVVGSDIGLRWPLIDGNAVADAQDRHPCPGERQPGGGAAFLFGQDHRDGPVVVVLGESSEQGDGVLVGDAQVSTGLVYRHRDIGDGATLPDDA